MNHKSIIPSERSKSQKAAYHMIAFTCNIQNRQIGIESRLVIAGERMGLRDLGIRDLRGQY